MCLYNVIVHTLAICPSGTFKVGWFWPPLTDTATYRAVLAHLKVSSDFYQHWLLVLRVFGYFSTGTIAWKVTVRLIFPSIKIKLWGSTSTTKNDDKDSELLKHSRCKNWLECYLWSLGELNRLYKGVFLVSAKTRLFPWNAITVWTHIKDFQLSHEGVSEVSERARERSKRA